jgi:hypothetical protein
MDQSAYVAGFFGVLIGITLTELIKGIAETLKNSRGGQESGRPSFIVEHPASVNLESLSEYFSKCAEFSCMSSE